MRKDKKRHYNLQFKQQAATLARDIGPKKAAEQLGVSVATMQNWQDENLSGSDSGRGARRESWSNDNQGRLG